MKASKASKIITCIEFGQAVVVVVMIINFAKHPANLIVIFCLIVSIAALVGIDFMRQVVERR